jgi:tetratricopeptide (TPR) repeat protein
VVEIYLERSRLPEALPHLERLYQQYPDRPDVQARKGQCLFLQGEVQEARRLLEAAVEKLPDDAPLLLYLAKLELHDDHPAKAEEWLRKVLKGDPADREAHHVLVSALQLQGRREEAKAALIQYSKQKALLEQSTRLLREEAERPTKDPAAAFAIGDLLLQVGQERLALYWLNQALRRDSNHQPAHKALADFYQSKGEQEKAEFHRRRLRSKDADTKSRKNTAPMP